MEVTRSICRIVLAFGLLDGIYGLHPTVMAATQPEQWALKGPFTNTAQYHTTFKSPYSGRNSLVAHEELKSTNDLTAFGALRLWKGAGLYINPEIDEGFGLSNTHGVGGFPSGEAYKVGEQTPYFRMQRLFLRQLIDLGGSLSPVAADINQLSDTLSSNHLILTLGKFSVTDVFDTNPYAHDPKGDFLNWSIIDAGAFDYAADAWGFTYGTTAELTYDAKTLRGGLFTLSTVPNSQKLDTSFKQYSLVGELEAPYHLLPQDGTFKILGFINYGRMGSYREAVRLGHATDSTPDITLTRRYRSRMGLALNIEQPLAASIGFFARMSLSDGSKEVYEFADIHQSISTGLCLPGTLWNRPKDTSGIAVVGNHFSHDGRQYLASAGLGLLIGDGQLVHHGWEQILEAYYSVPFLDYFMISADYQYIKNPAYNPDRGPVSIFGLRTHAAF
jgi:high affinity Mn2+ porin